jgi:hypothetical protein
LENPDTKIFLVGYFEASTGTAAAIVVAASAQRHVDDDKVNNVFAIVLEVEDLT